MDGFSQDAGYKYLFSSSRIACQLLHSFVDVPLVRNISPENLQLVDKSFVSDELLKRESDIIYKVNLKGASAYIYILLEFQSTPDKAMPARMLNYIMMFYDMILRSSRKGNLPAVLPLLLYSGEKDWNVPLKLERLIDPYLPEKYIPHFEYYPIIIKDYSDETLFQINNLVSAIMVVENSHEDGNYQELVSRVTECLKKEHGGDIRIFTNWFKQLINKKEPEVMVDDIFGLGDSSHMFAETAERLVKRWREEGIEQGIEQGIKQGIEQGIEQGELKEKHEILIRLMELKFGLDDNEREMIRKVQSPGVLDSALDAVVIVNDKLSVLGMLY
ncbi:MAG: hypothetical protein DRP49_04715 [Spirochaetes bacterium]|nr:MAG: hypothetical protein DRP49_04715 [Spirochaetota bacterium]